MSRDRWREHTHSWTDCLAQGVGRTKTAACAGTAQTRLSRCATVSHGLRWFGGRSSGLFGVCSVRPTLAVVLRQRCWLRAAIISCCIALIFCRSAYLANATEPAVTATTSGELTEAARTTITSRLQRLKQRLAELPTNPAVKPDHWADADIFIKGIVWALEFGPIEDAKDRELLQTALRRAEERIESLATGKPPWAEKKGTTIRGFISEVDGSTQPYGLRVPAGYDSSKPMRLDVVLHGSTRATGIAGLKFIQAYDSGDQEGVNPPGVDYIELFPMGRLGENAYRFEGETDVDEAIAAVCRNYRIDKTRMVLRGSSLGGVGTWIYQGELDSINLTGKRSGLQGPIDDAFATPFLCVRGTGTP